MFGWKKQQEEIDRLNSKIKELEKTQERLERILKHSKVENDFFIGQGCDDLGIMATSSDLYPVLYLYKDMIEYRVPMPEFINCWIRKSGCTLRYEGELAYFDTVVHTRSPLINRLPIRCSFIIDYKNGTHVKVENKEKEKEKEKEEIKIEDLEIRTLCSEQLFDGLELKYLTDEEVKDNLIDDMRNQIRECLKISKYSEEFRYAGAVKYRAELKVTIPKSST